jgi:hypothetical protein
MKKCPLTFTNPNGPMECIKGDCPYWEKGIMLSREFFSGKPVYDSDKCSKFGIMD